MRAEAGRGQSGAVEAIEQSNDSRFRVPSAETIKGRLNHPVLTNGTRARSNTRSGSEYLRARMPIRGELDGRTGHYYY